MRRIIILLVVCGLAGPAFADSSIFAKELKLKPEYRQCADDNACTYIYSKCAVTLAVSETSRKSITEKLALYDARENKVCTDSVGKIIEPKYPPPVPTIHCAEALCEIVSKDVIKNVIQEYRKALADEDSDAAAIFIAKPSEGAQLRTLFSRCYKNDDCVYVEGGCGGEEAVNHMSAQVVQSVLQEIGARTDCMMAPGPDGKPITTSPVPPSVKCIENRCKIVPKDSK